MYLQLFETRFYSHTGTNHPRSYILSFRLTVKENKIKAVVLLICYNVCFQLGMSHAKSTLLPIFLNFHPHLTILFNPSLVIERYPCRLLVINCKAAPLTEN